ncbi:MAG: response regulator [Candidatus Pristimantibacillus lignocellulolyticus]|uniref:Response regulator n=1 Tax=Candidatus Pristimantibacillus lignocellulolyticus TaxID=2994561 RepID=A0A9J6ZGX3_9BACL|nr:MAG: response regulator [Candidatus Pristimantibacillus lignocellulolyticus]
MLTAMIVDDEILSVKMMESIVDWSSLGIDIVSTAQNGLEALDLYYKHKHDVIISDIKMPKLNGLEFVKKIKEININTEFILISAYADFDYVKKAIELGCSNYILKPVDEFELVRTVKIITTKIKDKQTTEKYLVKNWKQRELQGLYRFMNTGSNQLQAVKSAANLNLNFSSYGLFRFVLKESSMNNYIENSLQLDAQMDYIMEQILTALNQYGKGILFDYEDNGWTAILTESDSQQFLKCSQHLISFLETQFKIDIYVCFSQQGSTMNELPHMYERLCNLSRYSFYVGDEQILGYGYNCEETSFKQLELLPYTHNITEALRNKDIPLAVQILDEVLLLSCKADPQSLHLFFEFFYNVTCAIRDQLITNNKITDENRHILNLSYKDIAQISKIDEINQFMRHLLLFVSDSKSATLEYSTLVYKGVQYLHEKYDQNFSLHDICNELAVSKNYFCYLFKRETGQNLWAYLTDIRLNKSKELLCTSELKSYEIAYKVGYDNPSYFSKLFKKYTGQTPSDYRIANK